MNGIYWVVVGPINDEIKKVEEELRSGYGRCGRTYVIPVEAMIRYNKLQQYRNHVEKEILATAKANAERDRNFVKSMQRYSKREALTRAFSFFAKFTGSFMEV